MQRRQFLGALGAAALCCSTVPVKWARANPPLRMLVGFAPGGAADLVARALAEGMRTSGYVTIVENKAGAGGRIAVDTLLTGGSDGNSVLFTPSTNLTLYPHLYKDLRYTTSDFTPLGTASQFDFALAVGSNSPAKTLQEFLQLAQKDMRMAVYGTPGVGTVMNYLGIMLGNVSKVALTPIPYKGGAPALADTVGGTLPALITTLPNLIPMHKSGKIRILATTGTSPSTDLPDVPTFAAAGYPSLKVAEYFALLGHKEMPTGQANALAGAVTKAVRSPEFEKVMRQQFFETKITEPAALKQQLEREYAFWGRVVDESGYRPEA
ncbi:tripartite tricarboxylate transporter substrate-binding protein [Achromobacter xylosoxidans]|uniref:tripartite tricarboxylate transporter substrate-binding protein n=1 Tax=Alcaligenes xylosoxydans xylosoxydans TaxID=85698 RepID=UPI00234B36E7|nr:tripartite tricarboxylate transporter substrate-binding protein [Achromobacter xylosoxidans]MDC6165487.1 tripartite tricarboxylate transporter substrate-binding protein [Achromobacter xylosoxidans]